MLETAATAPQKKKARGRAARYWDWRGGKDRHSRRSEVARRARFLRGQLKQVRARQAAEEAAKADLATAASKTAPKPKRKKLGTKPKAAASAASASSWTKEAVRGQVTVDCRSPPLPKRLRQQATGANSTPLGKAVPSFPRLTLRPKPGPKPKPPSKPPPGPPKPYNQQTSLL